MKTYLATSGSLFGLLVVAHIVRVLVEGAHVARDPWFVLFTILPAGLAVWAFRLLRTVKRT